MLPAPPSFKTRPPNRAFFISGRRERAIRWPPISHKSPPTDKRRRGPSLEIGVPQRSPGSLRFLWTKGRGGRVWGGRGPCRETFPGAFRSRCAPRTSVRTDGRINRKHRNELLGAPQPFGTQSSFTVALFRRWLPPSSGARCFVLFCLKMRLVL